jgi:hypothetical protein
LGEEELLSVIKERFEDIEKFIDHIEKFIKISLKIKKGGLRGSAENKLDDDN